MTWRAGLLFLLFQTGLATAETIDLTAPASATVQDGQAAWARIYEVVSHPRCANCHVGDSDRPMWSGPSYGSTRVHGMNIRAGDSRIGVEFIPCASCHVNNAATGSGNAPAHNAPRVAAPWRLAPIDAHWFGQSSATICAQLSDPDRNGNRNMMDLAAHLDHDVILHWSWAPGGDREPAPYSLQAHVKDILTWGVAGYPCPAE